MTQKENIAIVGGGLSGLAAAYRARTVFPDAKITILEASERLGGVLQTSSIDGYLVEHSADMFTTEPATAINLFEELGHSQEIVKTIPVEHRAYIAGTTGIHPVPPGFSLMLPSDVDSVLQSKLLSEEAKQRFLKEASIPVSDSEDDESLLSFATRRFGTEVFENLIQPLASGIYTADPAKLSMKATMSRFLQMEQDFGGLIAAGRNKKSTSDQKASGARYNLFRAPEKGMGEIIRWLDEALPEVEKRFDSRVESVFYDDESWKIKVSGESQPLPFGSVVIATSAKVAGGMLSNFDQALADELASIQAASSAIVVFGIDQAQLTRRFDGYGIVFPHSLGRQAIALSFSSNKFPGRSPDGKLLVRGFFGGALRPELASQPDETLTKLAIEELDRVVGLDGQPEFVRVFRWSECMPQYHLGHLERVNRIENLVAQQPGLTLAGNSYAGVGIPACVDSGFTAVDRLAGFFRD